MSSGMRVTAGLQVYNAARNNTIYNSSPTAFQCDYANGAGPTPGAVSVPTNVYQVNMTPITGIPVSGQPGWCRIANLDTTNFVEIGAYDTTSGVFYPLMELLPQEFIVIRLARFLGQAQIPGTGTGIKNADIVSLALKADVAPCQVQIDAFSK